MTDFRNYNHLEIEKKWQDRWLNHKVFQTLKNSDKPKYYCLIEFPYPSGNGLHVGHPRPYTAMDIVARKKRLQGYNVLFPMGWDAFGLPTENFAIKNKIHPEIVTKKNIARFKSQLQSLGFSFDWDREVNTTDPNYYKWTQWIFLQMFKKGLAYKKEMTVNWCTSCKCVLANEEVVSGHCERCGSIVVQRQKSQWMLKITAYAEELLQGLDEVDYIERVKTSQKNWIGRSVGASVAFPTQVQDNDNLVQPESSDLLCDSYPKLKLNSEKGQDLLEIFTSRPDTLFGVTYMVIAPEHPFVKKWAKNIKNYDEVVAYQEKAARKSDFERSELNKDKTGVRIEGIVAIHPLNNKEIPIFISDYVLATYGTGAVMAVPAHDTRDFEFAEKFNLPVIQVLEEKGKDKTELPFVAKENTSMINSDFLDGLSAQEASDKILQHLIDKGCGKKQINYKLRDWVFSRQRYWGEPIPMVYCESCGWVPLPESELPLKLPHVDSYETTDNGESPLAKLTDWLNTTCPKCGGKAKRETDTMPQWAGSSWYYLRYCDPDNNDALASKEALDYWTPVDWYNGGMEHTTLHLLYSRFWHKFLYDIGVVPTKEPYKKRTSHGMILGDGGHKMSKSLGNVINPDEVIQDVGADTLRLFEMFIGDFEKAAPWSTKGLMGSRRFIERVWNLQKFVLNDEELKNSKKKLDEDGYSQELVTIMHQSIKKVTNDIDALKPNTAIAQMMTLVNAFYAEKAVTPMEFKTLLVLLNPFAPHIAEELFEIMGYGENGICAETWPSFDEEKTQEDEVEIVLQINGKIKNRIKVARTLDKEALLEIAKKDEKMAELLEGKTIRKEIVIPESLVNIVAT